MITGSGRNSHPPQGGFSPSVFWKNLFSVGQINCHHACGGCGRGVGCGMWYLSDCDSLLIEIRVWGSLWPSCHHGNSDVVTAQNRALHSCPECPVFLGLLLPGIRSQHSVTPSGESSHLILLVPYHPRSHLFYCLLDTYHDLTAGLVYLFTWFSSVLWLWCKPQISGNVSVTLHWIPSL